MSGPLSHTDSQFLKHFFSMIAALAAILILLAIFAHVINSNSPKPANPGLNKVVGERLAPVGGVYAGNTGQAALEQAKAAAEKAAAAQVAYGGTTDGKTIFGDLCHTCHEAGIAGAPKLGDKAEWGPRIAQGIDTLVSHAIHGYTGKTGVMPAKGGNPALTDAQVKATVEWMVSQAK